MAKPTIKVRDNDYRDVINITPHNTTNIADDSTNNPLGYKVVNAIQVVVTGNFAVVVTKESAPASEVTITITGAPVGAVFNFGVIKRINSTGTTGTAVGLIR